MKDRIESVEDDFWTDHLSLFTAPFPTYSTTPQNVYGRVHTSKEQYEASRSEIIPLSERKGLRTYVMMHPYVLEPQHTLTIGLFNTPKQYADQESPIGEVIGAQLEGMREAQIGKAQAWYYHTDKTIVLWECFFDARFRTHPFPADTNMQNLWQSFEQYLLHKFPKATTLATPFNDPIARSIDEYQAFLKTLGYSSYAQAAFGKRLHPR